MKYSARQIAEYVISYCVRKGNPISNLQLQKILYFIQGEFYRSTGRILISDEFYAWPLGPVAVDVYDTYCVYGGGKIFEKSDFSLLPEVAEIVNPIINRRAKQSARQLVDESHRVGGAWKTVFNGNKATIIPKPLIMNEFKM